MTVKVQVGTSGFSYKQWCGPFYPEKHPSNQMLSYYAQRLGAVELNNTFYRMPRKTVLQSWAEQTPAHFRFAIKASRRISHVKRLQDAKEETSYLYTNLEVLGERLGCVLFQLPPFFRKDLDRLSRYLEDLPEDHRAAFEFRHRSWFEPQVLERLREHKAALCWVDQEDGDDAGFQVTASWCYLRLRRAEYDPEALNTWCQRIKDAGVDTAYVFFKHEDHGVGPALAKRFLDTWDTGADPGSKL